MDYYFHTKHMSVGYQGKPIIKDIELGLNKGEILTIIGPNGAGKSTILKSIARELALISGAAYLDKNELSNMTGTELSKRMAVVFTTKIKSELMTCKDIVATGRYPYTGRFGILSKEDNRICQEPEIIILDEPTSFLDVKYKLEFLSLLQKLRIKKGITVIMSIHELELAQRVSDKILCVKGEYVERFGTPEEIFQLGYLKSLFDIEIGSFDEDNTSMELQTVLGKPEVFVIAGGGSGRNIYRSLQRKGIPFATGILFENDLDCPVAMALATDVIKTEGFEPIHEELVKVAKEKIELCDRVICTKSKFGAFEKPNEELLHYAQALGKTVEWKGME
jgi:iron complex transport system ATP-binding protein